MSPEMFRVLCGVFAVWGLAITLKAFAAIRTGKPYVFSMWDGGALRAGKSLSPLGTKVKAAIGVIVTVVCILTAARIGSVAMIYGFVAIVAVGIVCDFVLAAD